MPPVGDSGAALSPIADDDVVGSDEGSGDGAVVGSGDVEAVGSCGAGLVDAVGS